MKESLKLQKRKKRQVQERAWMSNETTETEKKDRGEEIGRGRERESEAVLTTLVNKLNHDKKSFVNKSFRGNQ